MEGNMSLTQKITRESPAGESQGEVNSKPNNKPLSQLHEFKVVWPVKELAEITDKGISCLITVLGTILLILVILLRLRIVFVRTFELAQSEFISLLIVCVLLLFCGAYLRFYQYQKKCEISLSLSDTGARILEKSIEAVTKMSTGTAPGPNQST
jgi:nitrate reductase gamma subunit